MPPLAMLKAVEEIVVIGGMLPVAVGPNLRMLSLFGAWLRT